MSVRHDALLLLFQYFTTIFQFELAEFWRVGGGQKLQRTERLDDERAK